MPSITSLSSRTKNGAERYEYFDEAVPLTAKAIDHHNYNLLAFRPTKIHDRPMIRAPYYPSLSTLQATDLKMPVLPINSVGAV